MKLFMLLVLMLVTISCSTPMTTPPFAIGSENAWFLETNSSNQISRPIFCMADIKDGKANPKCYKSDTVPVSRALRSETTNP